MKSPFSLLAIMLLIKTADGQCSKSFFFESTKNKLIYNNEETQINFNASIEKVNDTIFIKHEIMRQKTVYKGYIRSGECEEWNKETNMGKMVYFVEEVSNKKRYQGKVIILSSASSTQVITELDSVEGLYKMNYEIEKIEITEH